MTEEQQQPTTENTTEQEKPVAVVAKETEKTKAPKEEKASSKKESKDGSGTDQKPSRSPRGQKPARRKRQRAQDSKDSSAEEKEEEKLFEKVVFINRCAKVVKGGRRFSFSALVVTGDQAGKVGVGFGKANEVSEAIRKATDGAKRDMQSIPLYGDTIPHEVFGTFSGGKVLLRPASPGTGIIAGGGVRAVLEAVGVNDVLAKSLGSGNQANVVKATLDALSQLRSREDIFSLRDKAIKKQEVIS